MALSDVDYALLAALANQPMTGMTGSNAEDGAGPLSNAEEIHNAVGLSSIKDLPAGWTVQPVTIDQVVDAVKAEAALRGAVAIDGDRHFSGMAAVLFRNNLTGEAVISFRGTQLNEGLLEMDEDIEADLRLGEGRPHTQFYAAYYFMKAAIGLLSPVQKANLTLTGHSLGGGIASLLGMYMGIKTKVFDPALSLRVARDMLGGGLDGIHAYASDQYIWPPIQGLGLSALQVESRGQTYVQTYISYGDPLSASFPSPNDVAGVRTYYHLKFDRSFFSDNLLELAGTKDNSLHSVNLVALQTQLVTSGITIEDDGTVSQNTALGTASDKLLDLMTQVFDPAVSLLNPIGKKLGVAPGRERYDLFLRQLVDDKINKEGKIVDAWIQDLKELGLAKGRLAAAGLGTEPGIKNKGAVLDN